MVAARGKQPALDLNAKMIRCTRNVWGTRVCSDTVHCLGCGESCRAVTATDCKLQASSFEHEVGSKVLFSQPLVFSCPAISSDLGLDSAPNSATTVHPCQYRWSVLCPATLWIDILDSRLTQTQQGAQGKPRIVPRHSAS